MSRTPLIAPEIHVGRVRILLHDVNVALEPLALPAGSPASRAGTAVVGEDAASATLLRNEFRFLSAPAEYAGCYATSTAVETKHFSFGPLAEELRHNRFWRDVATRGLEETGAWRRMLPFVGQPKEVRVSFASHDGAFACDVRPAVWLWPFGWSTVLDLVFERRLTLDEVRVITGEIDRGTPFRMNDESPATLSQLFSRLGTLVRDDVYSPSMRSMVMLPRHRVVSLQAVELPVPFTYGEDAHPSRPAFSVQDRARLHGAVLGQELDAPWLWDREDAWRRARRGEQRAGDRDAFTLTPLHDAGFAITHRDVGTLLFLSDVLPTRKRSVPDCLTGNVSACATYFHALRGACSRGERVTLPDGSVARDAVACAREALAHLPDRYPTEYCKRLCGAGSPGKAAGGAAGAAPHRFPRTHPKPRRTRKVAPGESRPRSESAVG